MKVARPTKGPAPTAFPAANALLISAFAYSLFFVWRVYDYHIYRLPEGAWEYDIFPLTSYVQPLAQNKALLYFHIATGAVPLLLGPFQLWPGSQERYLAWHRRVGTVYLCFALATALPALYMSWLFMVNVLAKVLVFILAAAFTLSVVKTYQHISGPDKSIKMHQQWATRTYCFMWILVLLARMIGAAIHHTAALPHPALTNWTVYITAALTWPVIEGVVSASCTV